MTKSLANEVAAILAVHPTEAELREVIEAADTVLAGITRQGRDWQVDPSLRHLTSRHSPARILREVRRGREAALIAQAAINAA